jgi:hypothetical protein
VSSLGVLHDLVVPGSSINCRPHRLAGIHVALRTNVLCACSPLTHSPPFLRRYVQCYSCGNPETVVKIRKENIQLKCKACGFVSDVDAGLKLNTFILKNPPDNKLSKEEKKCVRGIGVWGKGRVPVLPRAG